MKKQAISISLASCLFALSQGVWAANFVVQDIEVNGLERVAAGTVLNYIPADVGETFDDSQSAQVIQSLYKTGLFEDVRLNRRGNVLVVEVAERPAIAEINFSGNSEFKTDQLLEVLKQANISRGNTLDRSALSRIERELKEQYLAQGRYGVEVVSEVENLTRNRVAINVQIMEGKVARIKTVKIVGNKAFPEKRLLKLLDSGEKGSLAFFSSRDKYSKQKLVGDLDTLSSFYRDRGFLNFEIVSTQVSLTPDKKAVYVTLNISEGDQYRISSVNVLEGGNIPANELQSMIAVKKGQLFSQRLLEETRDSLTSKLGEKGYAFAKIGIADNIDEINKTVALTFEVSPGQRSYVRRINIKGNYRTRDEVYRREMRQLESSWYSKEKVERSKVRIQRLPYVEEVSIARTPVAGTNDQVDLEVTVKERLANQFSIGAGYSQSQGFLFNASLKQENFLGTGKRLAFAAENSDSVKNFRVGYTNPYYTIDGVSRGFTLYFNEYNADEDFASNYLSDRLGGNVHYTVPLSESNSLRFSIGADKRKITTSTETPDHIENFIAKHGDDYNQLEGSISYVHDTRDRTVFPTKGQRHSIGLESSLPGSDLEYNKVLYNGAFYHSLTDNLIFSARGRVGVGDGGGDLDELPFFDKFYAGGLRSVRGYDYHSLGPKDSNDDPKGGDFTTSATAEVIFPTPFLQDNKSIRMSAFFDVGNVYEDVDAFESDELRYSVGVGAIWLSPVGPITISYAEPLNREDGDETQKVQFSLGTSF